MNEMVITRLNYSVQQIMQKMRASTKRKYMTILFFDLTMIYAACHLIKS